jgi:hypothetical protein
MPVHHLLEQILNELRSPPANLRCSHSYHTKGATCYNNVIF